MGCYPAPTCRAALNEADFFWPGRVKASDGICGDEAHQARVSDHNSGNAFDLTHDPYHGLDTYSLAEQLRLSGDPRIKYVISFSRIWNPSISPNWRKYRGSNPHSKHMHVSIHESARNSKANWWARFMPKEVPDLTDEQDKMLKNTNHIAVVEFPKLKDKVVTMDKKIDEILKRLR